MNNQVRVMSAMTRREFGLGVLGALAGTAVGGPSLRAATKPSAKDALIVVDMQNCFMPGGSLAVKEGDRIVSLVNTLAKSFANVVITQDWHTADHVSFASQHQGKKPFDLVKLRYGDQVLWPDHCVQGTDGANLHKDLSIPHAQLIIRKGFRRDTDSYSAFLEADKTTSTGLAGYLRGRKIDRVFLCGLATDFCVFYSAMDARRAGFKAAVIEDACRGIDLNGSLAKAWTAMAKAGVERVQSTSIG